MYKASRWRYSGILFLFGCLVNQNDIKAFITWTQDPHNETFSQPRIDYDATKLCSLKTSCLLQAIIHETLWLEMLVTMFPGPIMTIMEMDIPNN